MIKTSAIVPTQKQHFSVVWDTGLRCNLDCTYCSSNRHNNYSPHTPLDDFIKTFTFIEQWSEIYNSRRRDKLDTLINFTGGEPTVNPAIWQLAEHIKKRPGKFYLSLTTNGVFNKQYLENILENFDMITVSYHAEAPQHAKDTVIRNIHLLQEAGFNLQVNIMLHENHWDECVTLYNQLRSQNINCKPRPIGDGKITYKTWFIDPEGSRRKTDHEYTVEQQEWLWKENGVNTKANKPAGGNEIGRSCCGGICLKGKIENEWQSIKLVNTEFKDWHCMVDWYFLYIAQHKNLVYHHQNCKALHGGSIGPIGSLDDTGKMLSDLKNRISQNNVEHIICPNNRCGCGMCAPKAKSLDDFNLIKESLII